MSVANALAADPELVDNVQGRVVAQTRTFFHVCNMPDGGSQQTLDDDGMSSQTCVLNRAGYGYRVANSDFG